LHRSKSGGLRVTADGITLEPHVVDARLATLCYWSGGGLGDAYFGLSFLLAQGDPFDALIELDRIVVFLARYMRQPVPWIESLTLGEARSYADRVSECIRAENGEGPDDEPTMAGPGERMRRVEEPPVEKTMAIPSLMPFVPREDH